MSPFTNVGRILGECWVSTRVPVGYGRHDVKTTPTSTVQVAVCGLLGIHTVLTFCKLHVLIQFCTKS